MNLTKTQRYILFGFAALFTVMIAVGIYFAAVQSQMGRISTALTPKDGTLKLDGKQIDTTGQTWVSEGKHTLEASRTAFTTKTEEFEIKKGETKSFTLYLLPEGGAGQAWVKEHPDEAGVIDGLIGKEYNDQANKVFAENPILQVLPIIDRTFRVSQGESQKGGPFALYIQAADQAGRDDALMAIKAYGFEPSQFEIIYRTAGQ